jgi:nitroreductase
VTEFAEVVRRRRMTRAFSPDPVDPQVLDDLVDLASRAPSAGKTQGWHLVVLEGADTALFWDITLPADRRSTFRWKRLLDAPVLALPLADPQAYTERYSEPDKARTGLGAGTDRWPTPYWTVDASMAVMTLLLAADDAGLGALFFGVFHNETALRRALGIPGELQLLGAIALGHCASNEVQENGAEDDAGDGRSANRRRRAPAEIIHRGRW